MKIIEQKAMIVEPDMLTDSIVNYLKRKVEEAGRTCYRSEANITDNSASEFIKKIADSGHHSVLEHVSISVRFITDRGITHELVRHRLAAYSQESTRYCNYGDKGITFIRPSWVSKDVLGEWTGEAFKIGSPGCRVWLRSMYDAEQRYLHLLELGWSPQFARSVLPNSLKTEIVMTANLREWLHVFDMRTSSAAHPQMRLLMMPLFKTFAEAFPEIYGRLYKERS